MARPKTWHTVSTLAEFLCYFNIKHQWRYNSDWFYRQCILCGRIRVSNHSTFDESGTPIIDANPLVRHFNK